MTPDRIDRQPSEEEQTGLSKVEKLLIEAGRSPWARGAAAVLGLGVVGGGSTMYADYFMQPPISVQAEQLRFDPPLTPTATPTLPPVIATAQAATLRIKAEAEATAIMLQARKDYPEWAAEEDRKEKKQQLDRILGMGIFYAAVIGIGVFALLGAYFNNLIPKKKQ